MRYDLWIEKNKRLVLIASIVILVIIMMLFVIKAKKRLALAPVFKIRPVPVNVARITKKRI